MPLNYVQSAKSKAIFVRGYIDGRSGERSSERQQMESHFYKAGRSAAMMGGGIAGALSLPELYAGAVEQYDSADDDGADQLARDFLALDGESVDTSALDDEAEDVEALDSDASDDAGVDDDGGEADSSDDGGSRWVTSNDGGECYYGSDSSGWLYGREAADAHALTFDDSSIPF